MLKRPLGFTLLELTNVIAIIGILSAIAIPNYMNYTIRAKISEGFILSDKLTASIADYYAYTGKLPENKQVLGMSETEQLTGKYVDDLQMEQGAIHIVFKEDIEFDDITEKGILTLRPALPDFYPPNNMITWVCGNATAANGLILKGENKTNLPTHYLPKHCL